MEEYLRILFPDTSPNPKGFQKQSTDEDNNDAGSEKLPF
jgi:hypothetical protein